MIFIYNESNKPWEQKTVNEKRVSISKSIKVRKKSQPDDIITRTATIHLDSAINFNDITNFTNMVKPSILSDDDIDVYFQPKDMRPFISKNCKYPKDIFFITLRLNGFNIEDIAKNNAFILNHYIGNGEFSAIISLGGKERFDLVISLVNGNTRKKYIFSKNDSANTYDLLVDEVSFNNPQDYKEKYKIENFRPASLTNLIFVHSDDEQALSNKLGENFERYSVCVFDDVKSLQSMANEYVNEFYRAATLFINAYGMGKNQSDDYNADYYEEFVDVLYNTFSILNIAFKGKYIKKL